MRKKHRKKKSSSWLIIAIGGVMLIVAVFFFVNQEGGGSPSITMDQQKIDYGDVKFNVEKSFAIKVTNTGDGTLRFKEKPYIEILEGC